MYVYRKAELNLWTVGFYSPDGKWNPESDFPSRTYAANRVHYLNGGGDNDSVYGTESSTAAIARVISKLLGNTAYQKEEPVNIADLAAAAVREINEFQRRLTN